MININTVRDKEKFMLLLNDLEKEIDSQINTLKTRICFPLNRFPTLSEKDFTRLFDCLRHRYIEFGGWGCQWSFKESSEIINMERYSIKLIEFQLFPPEKEV